MFDEEISDATNVGEQCDEYEENSEEDELFVEASNSLMLLIISLNLLAYVSESIRVMAGRYGTGR